MAGEESSSSSSSSSKSSNAAGSCSDNHQDNPIPQPPPTEGSFGKRPRRDIHSFPLFKRQCLGLSYPTLPDRMLAGLSYRPIDYLVLDYYSHKHSGRLSYSHDPACPLLAVGSIYNFGLSVWRHSFGSSRPVKVLTHHDLHEAPITYIQWSTFSDQQEVFTTSDDGAAKVFSLSDSRVVAEIKSGSNDISAHCVTQLDRQCFGVGFGKRWGLWDRRNPSLSCQSLEHGGIVTDLALVQQANLAYSSSVDNSVKVWDLRMGLESTPLAVMQFRKDDWAVASLQLHSHNSRLLTGCEGGIIYDIDVMGCTNQSEPLMIAPGHPLVRHTYTGHLNYSDLKRAQRSSDGRYIVCGADDAKTWIWDARTSEVVTKLCWYPEDDHSTSRTAILSAVITPTSPCFHVAMSDGWTCALFSYREGRDGKPLPPDTEFELLDDVFEEEATEEERADEYVDLREADMVEAWEYDPLQLQNGECSYSRGYANQLVYVCDTCMENSRARGGAGEQPPSVNDPWVHGLCQQCANHCHNIIGHQVRNLGEKKDFRCDCGNHRFCQASRLGTQFQCSLNAEKERGNKDNQYNHNWVNNWCYCDGPEQRPMIQCLACKDWFHGGCIHDGIDYDADEFENEDYLCQDCLRKHEVLGQLISKFPGKTWADRPALVGNGSNAPAATTTDSGPAAAAPDNDATTTTTVPVPTEASQPVGLGVATSGGQEEGQREGAKCELCGLGNLSATVACVRLVHCNGPLPPEEGEASEGAQPPPPCGKSYHPACLPAASNDRDHLNRWYCPDCRSQGGPPPSWGDLRPPSSPNDTSLPSLGWAMQRGWYMEPGWLDRLAEVDGGMAQEIRDVIGIIVMPPRQEEGAMPAPVVEGDASEADAGPVPGGQVIRAASSASSSSATPTLTEVSGAAGNIFASNLVGTPQQIDNFDEEIRRAVLAGDEATAYRLTLHKILQNVAHDIYAHRRTVILQSDISRAVGQLRQDGSTRDGTNQGGGGSSSSGGGGASSSSS